MDEACLRCTAVPLEPLAGAEGIAFFECPNCSRRYSRRDGGVLTDKWGSPISLALYPIIFTKHPQDDADRVAKLVLESDTRQEQKRLVSEIREELARPTQPVSAILSGLMGTEEDVREFLRMVADRIDAAMD